MSFQWFMVNMNGCDPGPGDPCYFDDEPIKVYMADEVDARIAELRKYLRALVAQCEKSPDGNVPIGGCTCAVCDLAREAALVASSL